MNEQVRELVEHHLTGMRDELGCVTEYEAKAAKEKSEWGMRAHALRLKIESFERALAEE